MTTNFNPRRRAALGASVAGGIALLAPARAGAQGRRRAAEGAPLPASDAERRVLGVLDDIYRNQRYLSVPEQDGRLLRLLAESKGAKNVLEIGTSTGYSGLWIALALLKTGGGLTTLEIDPDRHETARRNFERAGVAHLVNAISIDAHVFVRAMRMRPDLVFLDADKEGYPDYLKQILPFLQPGGLIVAHNMQSPPPDPRYVAAVTTDPALETVFLNMHEAGVGVTLKKR